MKASDDYSAKLRMWAERPEVRPMPKLANIPAFRSRKFNSYAEMNAWKSELLRMIAAQGCRWTS